ncbi:MAG: alanine:cation symporter family protein, partial [Gemmatimonadota bacterium]
MDQLRRLVDTLESTVWGAGISIGEDVIPFVVILLLGAGVFLTLRLGFIQLRRLGHGFGVTTGRYDDPDEPGDVSHFQALTTALSATVGIGNIAGVALAIHWGGPGALFWMWLTAVLGMATKYTEVT